jgi:hypothetical protein
MKRLFLLLVIVALLATPVVVLATPGGAVVTFRAKHVLPSGDTHPLEGGYIRWATSTMFTGMSHWHYTYLNAQGIARLTLTLPVICWNGTQDCFTLDGQWLYWTLVPPNYGACTLFDPPSGQQAYQGVTWVATQDMSFGSVWQGNCLP